MTHRKKRFSEQYGPWAVVAGASEGIGEEFATRLASEGLNLLLIARRREVLETLCARLSKVHGVQARALALDLTSPDLAGTVAAAAGGIEVGLLVYNAAHSPIGPFLGGPLDEHLRVVDLCCRGPVVLAHLLGKGMMERGHGGIVLMSSMTGWQGVGFLASYSAAKAFNLVFGEALWEELRRNGVDVLVCTAGATSTPGYLASRPGSLGPVGLPVARPREVVAETLAALGAGAVVVPGTANRVMRVVMNRILPRALAVRVMSSAVRRLYRRRDEK